MKWNNLYRASIVALILALSGCATSTKAASDAELSTPKEASSSDDSAEIDDPSTSGEERADVPYEEPEPAPRAELTPKQKIAQIWVTESEALPFQVMYVYQSKNEANEKIYCATIDGQALGAWPLAVDEESLSFKLWLRPGGPAGGPPDHFAGAPCPAAFAAKNLSDGVLPTTAPAVLEFQVDEQGLQARGARESVRFERVRGVDLNLLMSMAGNEHHNLHSEIVGFLENAVVRHGELTVVTSQENVSTVRGTVSALLQVMAANPDARFESSRDLDPVEPE